MHQIVIVFNDTFITYTYVWKYKRILVGNLEKCPLGRRKRIWKNIIKMDLRETGCEAGRRRELF
jgi:hypothetical protein